MSTTLPGAASTKPERSHRATTENHPCDALAVCQGRQPACSGCNKPSEGTRTARLLLDNMPAIERPPFYIFPRTLEEAFGIGQRSLNDSPKPMDRADRIVVRASGFAAAFLAAILLATSNPASTMTAEDPCITSFWGCGGKGHGNGNSGASSGSASAGAASGGTASGAGASGGSTGSTGGGQSSGGGKGDSPGKGDGKGHGHGKGDSKGHGGNGGKGGKK